MTRSRHLLLGLVVSLSAGCQTVLSANDYDQRCETDADCVVVPSDIDLCGPCGAGCVQGFSAINVAALKRYTADRDAIRSVCPPRLGPLPSCAPQNCRATVPIGLCSFSRCTVGG